MNYELSVVADLLSKIFSLNKKFDSRPFLTGFIVN
jgi:hypothetical protein